MGRHEKEFERDEEKARSNLIKHGVSFEEAQTVFADPLSLTGHDPDHSLNEDRFITMGTSLGGRLLVIAHTDRNDRLRMISAREATRPERKDYEDGNFP